MISTYICCFNSILYLFLCQDDDTQQLVLQTFHCDSEIYDGGAGGHFWGVGGVTQLCGDVQTESVHHINLLVTHFHLGKRKKKIFLNQMNYHNLIFYILLIAFNDFMNAKTIHQKKIIKAFNENIIVVLSR